MNPLNDGFGKYDVYSTCASKYHYKDTEVLRNRFGIRDANLLKQVEDDISTLRQQDLLRKPISGRFSPNHLCDIHKYLFSDIYAFAGH